MRFPTIFCAILVLCCLVLGCGGGEAGKEDRPPTHPVSITIKHNGTAVEGAIVTLVPQDREKGKASYGTTNAEGVAVMKTFEDGDGAIAGEYVVTVVKTEKPPEAAPQPSTDDPAYDPEAVNKPVPPPKHLLPEKYSKPGSLKFTVKEGENAETFDLK